MADRKQRVRRGWGTRSLLKLYLADYTPTRPQFLFSEPPKILTPTADQHSLLMSV